MEILCCRAVFVMGYYIFQKSAQLEVRCSTLCLAVQS